MIQNKIELLAPAGNKESFISAINAGANAVYLAGKNFGARKNADNFTEEEIKELITYAHLRNVRVFVTINTIIFEDELTDVFRYADYLVEHNVDALIVQDLGIIEAFCIRYPNTEIHASTQMNSYNMKQIEYLKNLGVKRVILARETSLEDIKYITSNIDMDIEVFIHGALCVSYSGNCLLSYFMGGRSGNRGECAQPCRLQYKLSRDHQVVSDSSYLMSTKDLMTIEYLKDIVESGVTSFKIEGRMKKPSYVAATVIAYKEALEHIDDSNFDLSKRIHELLVSFNREYTKGYILNEASYNINNSNRPNHQGIEIGKVLSYDRGKTTIRLTDALSVSDGIRIEGHTDIGGEVSRILKDDIKVEQAYKDDIVVLDIQRVVLKDSRVLKTLDIHQEKEMSLLVDETYKLIPLSGKMVCELGQPIKINICTPFIEQQTIVSDFVVQTAQQTETTIEDIYNTFNTLGNTFYYLADFEVQSDEHVFIPKSVLKQLKREAVERIQNASLMREPPMIKKVPLEETKSVLKQTRITVKVETLEQFNQCKNRNDLDIFTSENLKISHPNIYQNRIIKDYDKYKNYDNVIIQDFGSIKELHDKNLLANYNMNIANSYSVYSLVKRGVTHITLSLESTFENTKRIVHEYGRKHQSLPHLEVMIYGRNDTMISKYCPITKSEGVNRLNCNLCEQKDYALIDVSERTFPLVRDTGCNIRVLNHKPINIIDQMDMYKGIGIINFRIEFTTESKEEVENILKKI